MVEEHLDSNSNTSRYKTDNACSKGHNSPHILTPSPQPSSQSPVDGSLSLSVSFFRRALGGTLLCLSSHQTNLQTTLTTYPPTHPSLTTDRHVSDRQSACLPAKQSHNAKSHPNPAKDISSYTVNPLGLEETPNSSKPQNAAPHPWSCTSRQHGIFKPESCGLLNGSRIKKIYPPSCCLVEGFGIFVRGFGAQG